jgi:hypothetical protein
MVRGAGERDAPREQPNSLESLKCAPEGCATGAASLERSRRYPTRSTASSLPQAVSLKPSPSSSLPQTVSFKLSPSNRLPQTVSLKQSPSNRLPQTVSLKPSPSSRLVEAVLLTAAALPDPLPRAAHAQGTVRTHQVCECATRTHQVCECAARTHQVGDVWWLLRVCACGGPRVFLVRA